ncbi:hypothetical protein GCM10018954_003140 [Kutzneria kofuensis]
MAQENRWKDAVFLSPRSRPRREPTRPGAGSTVYSGPVELFFTILMVLVCVAIAWFSVYVVYRLLQDHR